MVEEVVNTTGTGALSPARWRRRAVAGLIAVIGALPAVPAGAAVEAAPFRASSTLEASTLAGFEQSGGVTRITLHNVLQLAGDLSGTGNEVATLTSTPDGTTFFTGDETCECTYERRTGTVRLRGAGRGRDGEFAGRFVAVGESGDLAGLVIHGEIHGVGETATFSGTALSH
jgi:hypothetical protein